MKVNLGFAPWDVFHKEVSNTVGISIGNASIVVRLVICILVALAGESLGLGTILNMVLIGVFLDFILESELLPEMGGVLSGTAMMIFGLFVIAFATYYYMRSGFGAGPRDGLMVVLERRSGMPVGTCRAIIKSFAVLLGWLVGRPHRDWINDYRLWHWSLCPNGLCHCRIPCYRNRTLKLQEYSDNFNGKKQHFLTLFKIS